MPKPITILLVLGIVAGWITPAAARAARQAAIPAPHVFALAGSDISGWPIAGVLASRRESNHRAWHDSQPFGRYFYRGAWSSLGRTAGWYERLTIYHRPIDAHATILVSEFADAATAAGAYAAVTKPWAALQNIRIGSRASEWRPSAGIGSGRQGCASVFGTFDTYVQYRTVLAEISSEESSSTCKSLTDAGPAIARKLVAIARTASIPMLSTSTMANGLRLTLSIPKQSYPLDGLALVTLQAINTTGSSITLTGRSTDCFNCALTIVETDASGRLIPMPERFADYSLAPPPNPPLSYILQPHQTLTLQRTVILWADHLQIYARAQSGYVLGAPLAVPFTAADPPRIDIVDSGGAPTAVVHISAGDRGPLLYRSSVRCVLASGQFVQNEVPAFAEVDDTWAHTGGLIINPPPCPQESGLATLSAWRLIAGWRNHSVAVADYHAP